MYGSEQPTELHASLQLFARRPEFLFRLKVVPRLAEAPQQ